ncbi:WYL domain-containing protein [Streptomyces olivoverticillatus]
MATNAIDQTRRMLSLVTYLRERPGARVSDVARAFGITEDELIGDLDVLPMCGTSFRGGDLLDIDTDGDRIWWHNPDASGTSTGQPLRLAADEATALLVAARAVATLPGLRESDRQALLRATAKIEAAAGEAAGASSRLSVTFESEGGVFADVDRAIAERRRVWLRYYSPARDELTEREVDPIRLFVVGHTYMEAWCRLSEARRTFRLDRVAEIRLLDEASDPPPVELRDLSEGLVQPAAEDPEVVIEVGPGGRWVAEYYPHDSAEELPEGGLRITLRTPDPASLRRLALRLGRDGRIVSPPAPRRGRPGRGPRGARGVRRVRRTGSQGAVGSERKDRESGWGRDGRANDGGRGLQGRLPRLPGQLRAGGGRTAAGDRRQRPHHLLLLHLPRLRLRRPQAGRGAHRRAADRRRRTHPAAAHHGLTGQRDPADSPSPR